MSSSNGPREQLLRHAGRREPHVNLWITASLSALLVLLVALILFSVSLLPNAVDSNFSSRSTIRQSVSATRVNMICPSRVGLPDKDNYGDPEYQPSEGDLRSSASYAGFGDVYRATVHSVRDFDSAQTVLRSPHQQDSILTASSNVDHEPQILEGRFTQAQSGTGVAASMASWATSGDVRGLAASSCIIPSMKQIFLIPSIREGVSHVLNVVNISGKASVIRVRAWSAGNRGEQVNLLTGSTVIVPAHADTSLNLSAAVPKAEGLYVEVSSGQSPVASFIKTTFMQTLVSQGVDIIMPLGTSSLRTQLLGITQADRGKLYMFSEQRTKVHISWLTNKQRAFMREYDLTARNVSSLSLSDIPEDAQGLEITATKPIAAMAMLERSGEHQQQDVAFVQPVQSHNISALVTPLSARETTLYLASLHDDVAVTIVAYNRNGEQVAQKSMELTSSSVSSFSMSDLDSDAQSVVVFAKTNIALAARLEKSELKEHKVAGISWIGSTSLQPRQMMVRVYPDKHIVN